MDPKVKGKLDNFFGKQKPMTYKKGQTIIGADKSISNIFYINKGLVKQFSYTENGEEIVINIFRPNSFFPIMIVLSETENQYEFQALDDCELYPCPTNEVINFLKSEPEVLLDLTKRFAKAIIGLSNRAQELTFSQADKKIISFLLYLAVRYGEKENGQIILDINLTHKDIAAWVGTTRETTSRQLEKLTKEGIISQSNHKIKIKDIEKLQDKL